MGHSISGVYIGAEVCDALGLDSKKVKNIIINIPANDEVTVTVEQHIYLEEIKKLNKVLTEFYLTPKEEEK